MSLIRLNARGDDQSELESATADSAESRLCHALSTAPHHYSAPIVIMIHGYKYDPARPDTNPHDLIFGQKHPNSWPIGLGISSRSATLGVSFGWRARGTPRRVFAAAGRRGSELAGLIALMQQIAPHRPVHIIAHSMGAEVALNALAKAPAHSIDRVILLAGATFQSRAAASLASPAGRTAELINITSHQNTFFDGLFEWLIPAPQRGDRAVGKGIGGENVINLRLDCPRTRAALRGLHVALAPPRHIMCHWSGYTTPGTLSFYGQLMTMPGVLSLRRLRQAVERTSPAERARGLGRLMGSWLTTRNSQERPFYDTAH